MREYGLGTGAIVAIVIIVIAGIACGVVGILSLTGGGIDLSTPEATINSFFNAMNAHDADAAWNCLSTRYQSYYHNGMRDSFDSRMENLKNCNHHLGGLQISNVNISGDNATATASYTLSFTYEGQSISEDVFATFYLIKEGGMWKIYDAWGGGTSMMDYPIVAATATKSGNTIRIDVYSGSIPAGDWYYSVSTTVENYSWTAGGATLQAPYVSLGTYTADNYYVSLRHKQSSHIYFADLNVEITG